jgi:DNA polymerase-3 subunit alpha
VGLVKFDFLGLTTLTVLDWAERYTRSLGKPDFSIEALPLDDKAAYSVLASGNATGVFQFESRGMRDLLKQARPPASRTVIALVALYRPGADGADPRLHPVQAGQEAHRLPDPRLEPILAPTYGIMVYQEQVMQIAQVIGGYSLGAADLLRPRDGQEAARGDGQAARHLRRRRAAATACSATARCSSST